MSTEYINDFQDLLTSVITWEKFSSRNDFGGRTFLPGIEFSARWAQKNQLVRDASGDEVVSSANIIIGKSIDTDMTDPPTISPEDRITLPDGSTPTILSATRSYDETGPAFTRVYFK